MQTIRMLVKGTFLGIILCWSAFAVANEQSDVELYIETYKNLAIAEMERSGIPASIKLAQGMLESGFGKSTLAQKSNNHFGIKCKASWEGRKYYHKDDDYVDGELIKSCFRAYDAVEDSYIDHTEFLMHRSFYSFLFDYDKTDYKNWAKGLKKAGYATSKTYTEKLISLIERYNLNRFDFMTVGLLANETKENEPEDKDLVAVIQPIEDAPKTEPFPIPEYDEVSTREAYLFFPSRENRDVFYNNKLKTIQVQEGDVPMQLARYHNISYKKLLKFNDLSPGQEVFVGDYLYLQRKRCKVGTKRPYHIVREGETMHVIAQLYGIRQSKLYKLNNMDKHEEPQIGEHISLHRNDGSKPKTYIGNLLPERPEPILKETGKGLTIITPPTYKKDGTPAVINKDIQRVHVVKRNETLESIAELYKVDLNTLKRINNIKGKKVHKGYVLRLPNK